MSVSRIIGTSVPLGRSIQFLRRSSTFFTFQAGHLPFSLSMQVIYLFTLQACHLAKFATLVIKCPTYTPFCKENYFNAISASSSTSSNTLARTHASSQWAATPARPTPSPASMSQPSQKASSTAAPSLKATTSNVSSSSSSKPRHRVC